MTRPVRIGITGASGFVGNALLSKLEALNYQCTVLQNKSPIQCADQTLVIQGGLGNLDCVEKFIHASDIIIHCGGVVAAKKKDLFFTVNTQGTKNIIDAMHDTKKTDTDKKILFISSLAARQPRISPYAKSKADAEICFNDRHSFGWDILRPPGIYGPYDDNTAPLFALLGKRLALKLGPKEARFSMIYIDDLVDAIISWIKTDNPTQQIYEISDGLADGYRWSAFTQICADLYDHKIHQIQLPRWFLKLVAFNASLLGAFSSKPVFFTQDKVNELSHDDWVAAHEKFAKAFKWSPHITAAEGLEKTKKWFADRPQAK